MRAMGEVEGNEEDRAIERGRGRERASENERGEERDVK